MVSAVIISTLSYHAVLLYVFPLLYAVQYRKKVVIWYAYAVNLLTITLSSIFSFYYGICDLNILLQSQHVRDWYLNIITEDALHIPFNEDPMFVIVVFMIFPRAIILLVFTIMMQYNVTSNVKDTFRIAQLTYDKNTDSNTNVYNKNKYQEMIATYYPQVERIGVAFWDLNDLKVINDKFGHAMGDRAIGKLSSILLSEATEACRIYRIGGDEFVTIFDNPAPEQMTKMVTSVLQQVQDTNTSEPFLFSVAVGYALGKGTDIFTIVKAADSRMYANKKLCKETQNQ
jgi:diguanylate cyclase (GGDEF)-like protein